MKLIKCISLYIALILLLSSCVLSNDDGNQTSDITDTYAESTQIITDTQTPATEKVMCRAEELAKKIPLYMPLADVCDVLGYYYEEEDFGEFVWNIIDNQKIKVVFQCGMYDVNPKENFRAVGVYWTENTCWTITEETDIDVVFLAKQITTDMLYEDVCNLFGAEPMMYLQNYEYWYYGENGSVIICFDRKWVYDENGMAHKNPNRGIVRASYITPEDIEFTIK